MSLGIIILVTLLPFGLALLLLYCYWHKDSFKCEKRAHNESKRDSCSQDNGQVCEPHLCLFTITVSDILLHIGVIICVIVFPIGIFIVILYCFLDKEKGNISYIIRRESAYTNVVNISIYSRDCINFSWYCRISGSTSLRIMFTPYVILLLS